MIDEVVNRLSGTHSKWVKKVEGLNIKQQAKKILKKSPEKERRKTTKPIPKSSSKAIVRETNIRIAKMRERFERYLVTLEARPNRETRVEREFKKTIKLTLIEVQDLMNQLRIKDHSENFYHLDKINDELDECFSILDSCLDSLEVGHNIGNHHKEENILSLQYHLYDSQQKSMTVEHRFVLGLPIDRDFRSRPRQNVSG